MYSKALVFSIALEGFEQTFGDCIKTQIEYCRRYQYDYVLIKRSPYHLYPDEAAWMKVPLIRAALAGNYEWVSFLDADCEIRSHTPGFSEHFSALSESKTIFMAPGFSGRLNSGVIFAKNSPASLSFFDKILINADLEIPTPEDRAPYENGHFIYYGKDNPAVYPLEHQLWNNNSRLDDKSYIQHYVRGPMREWYMNNRVLPKKESLIKKVLIDPFFNNNLNILKNKAQRPVKPMIISESINKLLPYYMKKYSVFCNT